MQKVNGNIAHAAIAALLVLLFMVLPQYTYGGYGQTESFNGIKLLFGCDLLSNAKQASLFSSFTTVLSWLFLVSLIGGIALAVMNRANAQVNKLANLTALVSALLLILILATSFHSNEGISSHVSWVGFIIMLLGTVALAIVPKKLFK